MNPVNWSKAHAKRIILQSQGLDKKVPFGRGKAGICTTLEQLGYVQIDSVSVITRAHHHTLWNRIPGYREEHLWDLLSSQKTIFEYWTHAASFLPTSHFRYYLPVMEQHRQSGHPWFQTDPKLTELILKRIENEGPLKAKDFKRTDKKKGTGWWDWKPAKKGLEALFFTGELMVSSRDKFHKVYDLPERVLPPDVILDMPSKGELNRFRIKRMLTAQGLMSIAEICYQQKNWKKEIITTVSEMCEEGVVIPVAVDGIEGLYFALVNAIEKKPAIRNTVRFLSPFDNLTIQRKRLSTLFQFEYQLECYLPAAKRKFGYFVLPILYGSQFAGRIEIKVHRSEKLLEVVAFYLEIKPDIELLEKTTEELGRFAKWSGCAKITVTRSQPASWKSKLEKKGNLLLGI